MNRVYQFAIGGYLVYKPERMYWYTWRVNNDDRFWAGAFTEKEFDERRNKDKGTRWEMFDIEKKYEIPEYYLAEVIEGDSNHAEIRIFLGRQPEDYCYTQNQQLHFNKIRINPYARKPTVRAKKRDNKKYNSR